MTTDEPRNVPPAQRLLRDGGLCSCFWRLPDGRPVLCALPIDEQHDHFFTFPTPVLCICGHDERHHEMHVGGVPFVRQCLWRGCGCPSFIADAPGPSCPPAFPSDGA